MNLQMIFRITAAAGHSGQNSTVRRSDIKLSRMVRYSCSFEFLVDLLFPDLCVRNETIALAALEGPSNPARYNFVSLEESVTHLFHAFLN